MSGTSAETDCPSHFEQGCLVYKGGCDAIHIASAVMRQ
jgi:hypothetical protein